MDFPFSRRRAGHKIRPFRAWFTDSLFSFLFPLNGKKLLSKNVTIPITDQTIEAGSWLRLVGPGGIYESYDLLTSSEISQGYKVMMVGNGSLRGSGTAINHIIPTFFIFEDTTISQCRLANTHPTADATPTAILLQVLAYTEGS